MAGNKPGEMSQTSVKDLGHHIRQPKYWCFSISSANEYSGLISFKIDCFDLLVVQGTLKSLLQHLNSKASILRFSALFMVQLSHPYMTTRKTIALTIWTFVSKLMSLLCNIVQVCHSFPSKEQVYFNFMIAVTIRGDFGTQENKICHCSHFSPFYLPFGDGTGCHDLSFFNPAFSLFSFTLIKRLFCSSSLPLEWYHLHI